MKVSFGSPQVCREQFVALHSQPILQELSNYLLQKYCTTPPLTVEAVSDYDVMVGRRASLFQFPVHPHPFPF
ncbi:DNA-directed RNA polymerase, mitochondrial [Liparis tanakae]|uniref:DNA-directed RNA polymerase, mitochondrial n=1 Tax=Liparis tanakae TaxID=230148 RepID=A0A4Z2ELZ4_9TELE|nr:DNA-directed RNA polymerase, mitochondrial [Liparis tanakae]